MRVHFQQLTEPIALLVDNYELFEFAFALQIPTPTQLRSPATRSRRLQDAPRSVSMTPRACGDPIRSAPL